jgi:SAM-dependent methyltransferase
MNLLAEDYSGINGQQQRDAEETIAKILQDSEEKFEIILDVGCGTGNVTALLSRKLPHDKIIALDIDPDMIKFSQKSLSASNIQFLVQDISLPWEQLHPKVKALEGQVSLAWSNRVLHWVADEDRPRAAANIVKLLKPGGRVYVNTTLMFDLNEHLPLEEKLANEKILKVPSLQEQHKDWERCFSGVGLSSLRVDFVEKEWTFDRSEDFWKLANVVTIYKRYLSKDVPPEKVDEILVNFRDLFARVVATPFGQPTVQDSENLTCWHYGQFRIIGKK